MGRRMSRISNRNYHQNRADDELRLAQEASDPAVANIHRELAALHRRRMMAVVDDVERAIPSSRTPMVGPGH